MNTPAAPAGIPPRLTGADVSRRTPAFWIATVGGVGLCPLAPGTAGTLVGMVLWWLSTHSPHAWIAQACVFLGVYAAGVWASAETERLLGRHDPSCVVIDETAAALLTFFALPFSWWCAGIGFAFNRVLDVFKPFGIGRLQRLPGGWGIMLDDVAAGLVSAVALRLAIFFIQR